MKGLKSIIIDRIKKLSPSKLDVLIVTYQRDIGDTEYECVRSILNEMHFRYGCSWITLPEDMKIECIPEKEMNRLGWYRK